MTSGARRVAGTAAFVAVAAMRLAFLFSGPGNYDTESYAIVAQIEAQHGNVYAETTRYNYSPVWAWLLLALDRIGKLAGLGLVRTTGLLLFCVDLATARVVARLAGERRGFGAGLLFFVNPVSVLISSWHLQFDALSILFLLLAVRFARIPATSRTRSVLALSASLLAKHVTWFHPLLFARRERPAKAAWYLLPYAIFIASFLPFAGSWRQIRDNVFRHRGLTGNYGTEALLLIGGVPDWVPPAIFAAAMLAAILFLPRRDPGRAALRLFLVLLVFLPGFARQYCVWPIALGSLFPGLGLLVYTVVCAGFLFRGFYGFDAVPAWLPGWYGPWWAAVLWLLLELREAARPSRNATGVA